MLAPGGRLAVALLHPVVTARLAGTYASERRYTVETPEKARLAMTYEGLHRPLTAYTAALAASGLVIEAIREPVKTDGDSVTMPFLDLLARGDQLEDTADGDTVSPPSRRSPVLRRLRPGVRPADHSPRPAMD